MGFQYRHSTGKPTDFKHNVVTQRTKEGDDEMVGDNKQTSLNTNGRK